MPTLRLRGADYVGLDPHFSTYATALTASAIGKAVRPSASYNVAAGVTVSLVGAGEQIIGRFTRYEDDQMSNIQDRGYCSLPFVAGATPTIGSKIYGGATSGTVASSTDGKHIVISIDSTNLLVTVKLD